MYMGKYLSQCCTILTCIRIVSCGAFGSDHGKHVFNHVLVQLPCEQGLDVVFCAEELPAIDGHLPANDTHRHPGS